MREWSDEERVRGGGEEKRERVRGGEVLLKWIADYSHGDVDRERGRRFTHLYKNKKTVICLRVDISICSIVILSGLPCSSRNRFG